MPRKHLKRIFRFCLLTFFITFIVLYISQSAGYVEYENRKQATLTQKQIKKFEADVKAGKNINLKEYLKTNQKNYQNKLSGFGLDVSKKMEKGVNKVVDISFKFLSDLAE